METKADLTKVISGFSNWIEDHFKEGWHAYLVSMMFKQINGSEAFRKAMMVREACIVFSTLVTRVVHKPNAKRNQGKLPFACLCSDYPVPKREKYTRRELLNLENDGQHLGGILMLHPDSRLLKKGVGLDEHWRTEQSLYVGSSPILERVHAERITETPARAVEYQLKSITRRRFTWDDVLILPKSRSELT